MGKKQRECPPHVPSGWECCVAHYGTDGKLLPACFKCKHCGHDIRPEKYEDDCGRCVESDNLKAGLCPKGHKAQESTRAGWKKCEPCGCEWGDGVISYTLRNG